MAKQKGCVKIKGTVDDNLNFYYNMVWGYLARMIPGVDSYRFWNDPAFEGSRRSDEGQEFLQLYMDDYDWKIRFKGEFPPDYQVPFFCLSMLLKEVCSS